MAKDRLGRWSQNKYDNLDQLRESIDPLGRKTKYCWCDCGSIAELTDPAGNKTTWHHDLQGRIIQKVYADGTDVDFTYEQLAGRLDSRTDALGQVTSYRYNLDNSPQITQYSNEVNATSDVSIQYDPVFPRTLSRKNGWGKNSNVFPVYDGPILLTGNPTTNDVVNFYITNSSLSGGQYQFQYQVSSGDTTLTALATSIKNAINGNGTLTGAGISATSSGDLITVSGSNPTRVFPNTNGVTTISLSLLPGGTTEIGTKTVVVIYDPGLNANGYQEFTYTVGSNNEPLSNCTSSLATSITSALSGNGITASASGATLTITSTSLNRTTVSSRMLSNQTVYLAITGGPSEVASSTISSDGGNAVRSETNNVISNSAISYTYDVLNRITNRSINSSSNSTTWTFDAINRVTSEVDPLGTFNFTYVDNTSGSSKGDFRLSSIGYPNSQTTNFTWLPNIADQRLHQIVNLNPSSAVLSQFNYGYNAAGEITQWQQKQNSTDKHMTLGYDMAGQLKSAPTDSGSRFKIYISGTTSAAETFTVTAYDASLTGTSPVGQETATYNASSSTSASTVASNLATQINSVMGTNLGISASASGSIITVDTDPAYTTSFSVNRTGKGTIISIENLSDEYARATINGTPRTGDSTAITAFDTTVGGGQETASYTVQSGDTTTDIAENLVSQINSVMSNVSVVATSRGPVITILKSPDYGTTFSAGAPGNSELISIGSANPIADLHTQQYYFYDCAGNRTGIQGDSTGSFPSGLTTNALQSAYNNLNQITSSSAGGQIRFEGSTTNPIKNAAVNVTKLATISGSITAGDTLRLIVHDNGLSQAEPVSYVVQSGDSTTSIATALKNAINGNTTLSTLGVTATSSAAVITITSSSQSATTYTVETSAGATETVSLNDSASQSAKVSPSNDFAAEPRLSSGANTAVVTAVSGGGTATADSFPISISSSATKSFTHDLNGNMTSDGTNTFDWDAEDRLIKIVYPGSGDFTEFAYDSLGRQVKIVETQSSSITATRQFVWCGAQRCEERDGSGSLSNGKQFFPLGQVNFASGSPTNYFYTTDHLGSTREMTKTVSGTTTIEAQYAYDPYGIATKLQGSQDADFQYGGYYVHAPSGLNLTMFRAYNPVLGRWLSRDPIGEALGPNLYGYVGGNPMSLRDPLGLQAVDGGGNYGPSTLIGGEGYAGSRSEAEQLADFYMRTGEPALLLLGLGELGEGAAGSGASIRGINGLRSCSGAVRFPFGWGPRAKPLGSLNPQKSAEIYKAYNTYLDKFYAAVKDYKFNKEVFESINMKTDVLKNDLAEAIGKASAELDQALAAISKRYK